jgi:hypothetical protein
MTNTEERQVNHPLFVNVDRYCPINETKYAGLGGVQSPPPYAVSVGLKMVLGYNIRVKLLACPVSFSVFTYNQQK